MLVLRKTLKNDGLPALWLDEVASKEAGGADSVDGPDEDTRVLEGGTHGVKGVQCDLMARGNGCWVVKGTVGHGGGEYG